MRAILEEKLEKNQGAAAKACPGRLMWEVQLLY
jgi:hypothetical protein